jgi:putative transposase
VEADNPMISVSRQCALLGLNRSSYYYAPLGENPFNLFLMRLIDEHHTRRPTFGVEKMTDWLRNQGCWVNEKRIDRLMKIMGLSAIYPKPRLSQPGKDHKKYPYLLRNVVVDHPDQVWTSDITYIRLRHGFVFLVVIMDWFSRYVVSWNLSITLEKEFCIEALEDALGVSEPEIFNSDQGGQYTSDDFTDVLKAHDIKISMAGRDRLYDNIFVERLWRTVKYEEVYIHDYLSVPEARESLSDFFYFYNTERPHASLNGRTPFDVYNGIPAVPKVDFRLRV